MTTRTRMYVIKLNDTVVYLKHTGVWLPCFGAPCFPLGGWVGCFFVCSLWRMSTLHNGVNGMAGHPKPQAQADSWRLYRDLCELPVIVLLLYRQGKCVFVTPSMDAKQHLNIMCINPIWVFAPNHVFMPINALDSKISKLPYIVAHTVESGFCWNRWLDNTCWWQLQQGCMSLNLMTL